MPGALAVALALGCGGVDPGPLPRAPQPEARSRGDSRGQREEDARARLRLELSRELRCGEAPRLTRAGALGLLSCGTQLEELVAGEWKPLGAVPSSGSQGLARAIAGVAGSGREDLWLSTVEPAANGNSTQARFYRWEKEVFREHARAPSGVGAPLLLSWERGSALGLVIAPPGQLHLIPLGEIEQIGKPRGAGEPGSRVPRLQPGGASPHPFCEVQMRAAEAAVELAPGDVMIFSGQVCSTVSERRGESEVVNRGLGVERLRRGQAHGEITLLPAPRGVSGDWQWAVTAAVAPSPGEALVAVRGFGGEEGASIPGFALRFDGATWSELPSLSSAAIERLWPGGPQELWALDGSAGLWRRAGSAWRRMEPGLDLSSEQVLDLMIDGRDLWLLAGRRGSREPVVRLYHADLGD